MRQWRRFRLWLHQFNPVAIWREERRLDREAQLAVAEEIGHAVRSQSEVASKALDLAAQMVSNMTVDPSEAPQSWTVREEDEVAAAKQRLNAEYVSPDFEY